MLLHSESDLSDLSEDDLSFPKDLPPPRPICNESLQTTVDQVPNNNKHNTPVTNALLDDKGTSRASKNDGKGKSGKRRRKQKLTNQEKNE